MGTFRPSTVLEYVGWLRQFVAHGGKITHSYDYPYNRSQVLVARRDFRLGGECGAGARGIIVPKGVRFIGGELGHNALFFEDGWRHEGRFAPVYSDSAFDCIHGINEVRAAKAARTKAWKDETARREAEDAARAARSDLSAYLARQARGSIAPQVGFLSLLTKKQQEMAMSYTGHENIGDDQFRIHPASASTPTTPTHASASPSGQPQQGTPLDPPKTGL